MRRLLRKLLFVALIGLVLFGTLIGYLGATTARPRTSSEGWERLANLPDPRGEVATTVGARAPDPMAPTRALRQHLFVIGGIAGLGKTVTTVSLYDPASDTWTRGPDIPDRRHHSAAAAIEGTVYVTGGSKRATNWRPEQTLWILAPQDRSWRAGPPMPQGRMAHQMVAVDGRLFVVGGRGETSNVLIFDPGEGRWRTGAEMPVPRDHLAVVVAGGKIYAIGGRDDDLSARVDIYDPETDAWSDGPSLPQPMSGMAAGAIDDVIHVVGGEDPKTVGGGVIDRHFSLLPMAPSWEVAAPPLVAAHGSAGAVVDGRLLVAGGARRQGSFSPIGWTGVLQAFDPDEAS